MGRGDKLLYQHLDVLYRWECLDVVVCATDLLRPSATVKFVFPCRYRRAL